MLRSQNGDAPGQIDVYAPRPVALLATYVDLLPRRMIRVRTRVVVLVYVRRMAIGARRVPVLGDAGPVERVTRLDPLVRHIRRRDEKPLFLLHVPRLAQHLHTPIGKFNHVLLQGPNAERVLDLVIVILAVRPFRVDHELAIVAEKPCGDTVVFELRIVEVRFHSRVGSQVHRPVVVRAEPQLVLSLVAFSQVCRPT